MMASWRYLDWLEEISFCRMSRTLASVARICRRMEASSGAGGVGNLLLPQDGVGDGVLQKAVGGQGVEQVGDGGLLLPGAVLPGGAGRPQHGGDVQQLPGVQAAPHVRPLEAGAPPAGPRRSRACPAAPASSPRRRSPPGPAARPPDRSWAAGPGSAPSPRR